MEHLYQLTDEDKLFWFSFIETKIGLILPEIQQRHFEAKILDKMQFYQANSDEYFEKVKNDESEWQSLINELTIPETSFFRHSASFDLIKNYLSSRGTKAVRIWSVGCSTGEEAWSLAMLADQQVVNYRVMATDINEISLNKAKQGRYSARKTHILDEIYKRSYFEIINQDKVKKSSSLMDEYSIKPFLKNNVSFYKYNLVSPNKIPFREMDVIFCQNVLIYFRGFVQRDILNKLVQSLSVGGILVMAPAEARSWKHSDMERVSYPGTLAYKRVR